MYKLDIPVDYKEAAAIERRRAQEEQRKSRIFNSKVRQIGVDQQALEQQVKDRKQMEEYEKKREEAFAADAVRCDHIAELLQHRQEHDTKELNRAINEFRMLHQQADSRREYDLYDPDAKKKDKPARLNDDDPRCGPASLQKFDGEDLNYEARTKFQREQMREWSDLQKKERDRAEHNQKRADYLYQLKMREMDQRACELQRAEEECRKAIDTATKDYNLALQRETEERRRLQEQRDLDDKRTEMANHLYGDFLTENPAAAQSAFGAHRVIPDRWKGMTPEQLEEIRRTQTIQREEAARRRAEEKREQEEFDRRRLAHDHAVELLQREEERVKQAIRKQQADENLRLMREQKALKAYMDKDVYTNQPTDRKSVV